MFWKRFLGIFGESQAARFLKSRGYRIIKKNYRTRFGEIDIIARDGNVLVFVEVKTVVPGKVEKPTDTVNFRKQRHIAKSAEDYLQREVKSDYDCRFDVVAIEYINNGKPRIELIKDAF